MKIIWRWGIGWILSIKPTFNDAKHYAYYNNKWNQWFLNEPRKALMKDYVCKDL